MRYSIFIVAGFIVLFILPVYAHAIIFLPAIILIPIAKIIALIIGGFSLPALGTGVLYTKLFGKPVRKAVTIALIIVIFLAIMVGIYLKIENPDRPLF